MMFKKIIAIVAVSLSLLLPTAVVSASDTELFGACSAATQSSSICKDKGTTKNPVNHYIQITATIIASLTGVAAVIFIVLGGLTMASSGGNTEAVANARKRIVYALIGLVIVALSWSIIIFLTNRLIKT